MLSEYFFFKICQSDNEILNNYHTYGAPGLILRDFALQFLKYVDGPHRGPVADFLLAVYCQMREGGQLVHPRPLGCQ